MAANSPDSTRRLYILGGIFFLWLSLVAGRLVQLQVVGYGEWMQRAQRQQQRTIEVSPRRGIIYDRNGRELAMSVMAESVFAVPSEIPDQPNTASLLARVLRADPREVLARLQSSRTFCWVARKLDAPTSQRIRALNLRGIYFQKEPKRYYPKRELGAQVLGYVGLDDEGLSGIERAFDPRLKGRPGKMLVSVDARRKGFNRVERHPEPGQNVVLTVDEHIQYIAERELERAWRDTRAEAATLVVQNPHTGEILALANRPTFNPNLSRAITTQQLKNRAVSDVYEPGSTFKLVTVSAALEEKLTRPEEVIDCQMGAIIVGGLRIRDHEKFGLLNVSQVLEKSSDVGAIKLGLRLGEERFDSYIRKFGFGAQTGIELPGETRGLAKPANRWSKVSIGAISMGQEIGITPLQLVSMVSTIANDGIWTPPRIVAGITAPRATPQTVVFRPAQQRRVISPLTAARMRQIMERVVLFGTGRKAILDGYTSAGKTGTAQKADPNTGAYSHSKYVATFVGFAPVNNPAVTIAVIIDSAIGLHQGGQISAPVFQRVAQQVLEYMNVPHDAEIKNPKRLLLRASVKDAELDESSDRLGAWIEVADSPGAEPVQLASAQPPAGGTRLAPTAAGRHVTAPPAMPVAQFPMPAVSPLPASGTVVLDVESGVLVPSFLGKSMRAAIEQAQESGIEIEAVGTGIARDQYPAPGAKMPAGRRVAVRFRR
jgi:cell division protein FtsI (penicillin-binding protein 3)